LWPLMFAYNTSFHRSTKATPFFLTFGLEPRQPQFPGPDVRRKFYGESTTDELLHRLMTARDVARRNNEVVSAKNELYHNQRAEPHNFQKGQLVLLDEHSFLHKNAKLAPKWTGPHKIARLKNDNNVELKLKNGRSLITHVNRLKHYQVPLSEMTSKEFVETTSKGQDQPSKELDKNSTKESEVQNLNDQLARHEHHLPPPPPPITFEKREDAAVVGNPSTAEPVFPDDVPLAQLRRRGRPRKVRIIMPEITISDEMMKDDETIGVELLQQKVIDNDDDNDAPWIKVVRRKRKSESRRLSRKPKFETKEWTRAQNNNYRRFGDVYDKSVSENVQIPEPVDDGSSVSHESEDGEELLQEAEGGAEFQEDIWRWQIGDVDRRADEFHDADDVIDDDDFLADDARAAQQDAESAVPSGAVQRQPRGAELRDPADGAAQAGPTNKGRRAVDRSQFRARSRSASRQVSPKRSLSSPPSTDRGQDRRSSAAAAAEVEEEAIYESFGESDEEYYDEEDLDNLEATRRRARARLAQASGAPRASVHVQQDRRLAGEKSRSAKGPSRAGAPVRDLLKAPFNPFNLLRGKSVFVPESPDPPRRTRSQKPDLDPDILHKYPKK